MRIRKKTIDLETLRAIHDLGALAMGFVRRVNKGETINFSNGETIWEVSPKK